MSILTARRVRLGLDLEDLGNAADELRGGNPESWQGGELRVECAVLESAAVVNVSQIASATLNFCENHTVVLSATTESINAALTQEQWQAHTAQHFAFDLTAEQMNWVIAGNASTRTFGWYVELLTTSPVKRVPAGSTVFTLHKFCRDDTPADPENPPSHLTKEEADTLYLAKAYKNGNFRVFDDGNLYIWDYDNEHWRLPFFHGGVLQNQQKAEE